MIDDGSDPNTIAYQRDYWSGVLDAEVEHARAVGTWSDLGKSWGDPESDHAIDNVGRPLGSYVTALSRLLSLVTTGSDVVEIGSYGGKWTRYLLHARRVWCVDLYAESLMALTIRFGSMPNATFYCTPGDNLADVADASVDLVFSMDTLVRAPIDAIALYLAEFYRVLRVGGHVLVHLPWDDSPGSRERSFTRLSRPWLLAHISQFRQADLDDTTLKHGLLLHLVK